MFFPLSENDISPLSRNVIFVLSCLCCLISFLFCIYFTVLLPIYLHLPPFLSPFFLFSLTFSPFFSSSFHIFSLVSWNKKGPKWQPSFRLFRWQLTRALITRAVSRFQSSWRQSTTVVAGFDPQKIENLRAYVRSLLLAGSLSRGHQQQPGR